MKYNLKGILLQSVQGLLKRYYGVIQPNIIKQLYNSDPSKNKNLSQFMCLLYIQLVKTHSSSTALSSTKDIIKRFHNILLVKSKYNIQIPNQVNILKKYDQLLQFVQQSEQIIENKQTGKHLIKLLQSLDDIQIIDKNSN